jgi:hypothetical protein
MSCLVDFREFVYFSIQVSKVVLRICFLVVVVSETHTPQALQGSNISSDPVVKGDNTSAKHTVPVDMYMFELFVTPYRGCGECQKSFK